MTTQQNGGFIIQPGTEEVPPPAVCLKKNPIFRRLQLHPQTGSCRVCSLSRQKRNGDNSFSRLVRAGISIAPANGFARLTRRGPLFSVNLFRASGGRQTRDGSGTIDSVPCGPRIRRAVSNSRWFPFSGCRVLNILFTLDCPLP
jgi:hypothetical protein